MHLEYLLHQYGGAKQQDEQYILPYLDATGNIKFPLYKILTHCVPMDVLTQCVSEVSRRVDKEYTISDDTVTIDSIVFRVARVTHVGDMPKKLVYRLMDYVYKHSDKFSGRQPTARHKKCRVDRVFMDGDSVPAEILDNPDPEVIGIIMKNDADYATCYRRSELFSAWKKDSNQEYIGIHINKKRGNIGHIVHKLPYEGVWVYRAYRTLKQYPDTRVFRLKSMGRMPIGSDRGGVGTIHGEIHEIFMLIPGLGSKLHADVSARVPNARVEYWDIVDPTNDIYEGSTGANHIVLGTGERLPPSRASRSRSRSSITAPAQFIERPPTTFDGGDIFGHIYPLEEPEEFGSYIRPRSPPGFDYDSDSFGRGGLFTQDALPMFDPGEDLFIREL